MNLFEDVRAALASCPDKVIARDEHRELTGSALLRAARAAARAIAAATARPRVGVFMPGCAVYPPVLLGALAAGKVPVLLNHMLKPGELDFILREAETDLVVVSGTAGTAADGLGVKTVAAEELVRVGDTEPAAFAPAAPGAVAVLLYTSGTTGRPKGVPLTHENLLSNARAIIDYVGARPDDVFLALLPPFHAFGLTASMVVPLLTGAEVTFVPRLTPAAVFAAMARRGATNLVAVPSFYRLLARVGPPPEATRKLRIALSGGDALPAPVRGAFRERFGLELLEGYGLTETSPVVCVNSLEYNRPGTVGRVLPGVRVRIGGPECTDRSPGRQGEIQVRGPGVMAGYFNRPEENAAAFTPDGWFRTGDLGRLDADGYLTVVGRIKEIIVRDGEKVMPREVEAVLERHPLVADAAVIGEPDPGRGEAIVAFVVPGEAIPAEPDLRAFCRGHLAEFKVPRRFVVARDLPRGPTGKILKRLLPDWKPAATDAKVPPREKA
jgi:long-chain acyl-CoA synthetase